MIRLSQDRVSGGKGDEVIKGCSTVRCPDKRYTFLEEVQERSGDVSKARNKGTVVT